MSVDHPSKEFNSRVFPRLLRVNDNDVEHIGYTDMSPGEMKAAMSKRDWIISEYIGDNDQWLCFFRTASGIRGTEKPHEGYPHIHFISSAWG